MSVYETIHNITNKVLLSGIAPLIDVDLIKELNVTLIVCCCDPAEDEDLILYQQEMQKEIPSIRILNLHYSDLPAQDLTKCEMSSNYGAISTENALELSFREIDSNSGKTLVHCMAGISRSVSVVCYYLMKKFGMTFDIALSHVKNARHIACPNASFQRQLREISFP